MHDGRHPGRLGEEAGRVAFEGEHVCRAGDGVGELAVDLDGRAVGEEELECAVGERRDALGPDGGAVGLGSISLRSKRVEATRRGKRLT